MGRDERSRIGSADEARTPPASVPQRFSDSDRSCPLYERPWPLFEGSGLSVHALEGGDCDGLTERAIAELLLAVEVSRHAALHDPLTGLANRSLILDHLHRALARADRRKTLVAVVFVDLDDFKRINDTLGHLAGDEVLVEVARRLRPAVRPADTLGRWSGDEFVVVSEDLERAADAPAIVGRIAAAFEALFAVAGTELHVNASIGVAVSAGGDQPVSLIAAADSAMYRSKRGSPGRPRHRPDRAAFPLLVAGGLPQHDRLTRHLLEVLAAVEVDDHPPPDQADPRAEVAS